MDGTPSLSIVSWFAAAIPILTLLYLMVGRSWGGGKAGAAGWLSALAVAFLFYGADTTLIAFSQTKAALLSVWVLYIIWAALLLFHIANEAGAIKIIGDGLIQMTRSRSMQLLLLAWAFTSFLQGISGYGVPVAIVAPLMAAIGFSPIVSVIATSIGHTWAVTFGSLGASFFAIVGVTGSDPETIAGPLAIMLGLTCYLAGSGAVWSYGGWRLTARAVPVILIMGTLMGVTQWLVAVAGFYSLASFTAGLVGISAGIVLARVPIFDKLMRGSDDALEIAVEDRVSFKRFLLAVAPYLVVIIIVLAANLVSPIGNFLNAVSIDPSFPETETSFGWTNPATDSFRSVSPFGHAGALLLYSGVTGFLIFRAAGWYTQGAESRIIRNMLKGAVGSSLGIVTLVGTALIMMESGMIQVLAEGIAETAGGAFPFLSPFVGVLGAFMTGSNTNSNILFGALQHDTAELLSLPVTVILASQTTGGALGGIIAPAKIIVGCSTVGLSGKEGPVIRASVKYGLTITAIVGVITMVWVWIVG